jgi:hypothetical protein
MSAGYSGTPLARKLGIKPGARVATLDAPDHFRDLLEPVPDDVAEPGGPGTGDDTAPGEATPYDVVVLFAHDTASLDRLLPRAKPHLASDGGLWIAWPKKSSDLHRDLAREPVRAAVLETGLVDNKVCAIDQDWSGLRFVYRVEDRYRRSGSGSPARSTPIAWTICRCPCVAAWSRTACWSSTVTRNGVSSSRRTRAGCTSTSCRSSSGTPGRRCVVDPQKARSLLALYRRYRGYLAELAERSDDELRSDFAVMGGLQHYLMLLVETVLDLGSHVISSEGYDPPRYYADVFRVLQDEGVLPPSSPIGSWPWPGSATCWCTSTPTWTRTG